MPMRVVRSVALSLMLSGAVLAGVARAQTPPPFNGIAHIAVRVSDLEASRAFYKKLGFTEVFSLSRNGKVYEAFFKINDKQFMELYPTTPKNTQIGFLHLCFEGADLNAIHDDYVREGLTPISVRKAGAGNLLFTVPGPEQPFGPQNIEFTQYMPGSLHSKMVGKYLGPDRVGTKMVTVWLAMKDPQAARTFYLDKLHFTASKKDPMLLNLPGDSGEHVEIASDAQGDHSKIELSTPDMKKTVQHLKDEDVPFQRHHRVLTITDPDGNILMVKPQGR